MRISKRWLLTRTGLLAVLLTAPAGAVSPGAPDPTFSSDGRQIVWFDLVGLNRDLGWDALVEEDGSVIVVGAVESGIENHYDWAIAKLGPSGTLVAGWGDSGNGKTLVGFGHQKEAATAIVRDFSGRYVVAGYSGDSSSGTDFHVIRLSSNGNRDYTFNGTGTVAADFSGGDPARKYDIPTAIGQQGSGRIVVAGFGAATSDQGHGAETALLGLEETGVPDVNFSSGGAMGDGKCLRDWAYYSALIEGVQISDLAIEPGSDKLIVVGRGFDEATPTYAIAVQRMTSLCDRDAGFANSAGQLLYAFSDSSIPHEAHGVALVPTLVSGVVVASKIVVAGAVYETSSSSFDFGVLRLNPNGTSDSSFGGSGLGYRRIPWDMGDTSHDLGFDLALQGDGKILIGGAVDTAAGGYDFGAVRLHADGSTDLGFGLFGHTFVNFAGGGTNDDYAHALKLAPDGRVVLVGDASSSSGSGDRDWGIVRLQNDYLFADGFEWGSTDSWSEVTPP